MISFSPPQFVDTAEYQSYDPHHRNEEPVPYVADPLFYDSDSI